MYIEREIKEIFEKVAKIYPIVALVGPRQAGKTTFLKEQIAGKKAAYIFFDDPDMKNLFNEDIKKFEHQYLENNEISVLDEVQYCEDAGRKLKYLAEKGKTIWVTSSSEIILGKEVLSYLVGRVSIVKLYPFSITEFLKSKKQKELNPQITERNVWEHMVFGGYPKVVLTEDIELRKIILKDLYETMVLKDIARTFSIEDISSLEEFTRYLSINLGELLSYEKIANTIKVSFQTIKKYLYAMEKSYLIIRVIPFYKNKLKEIKKQPKIYFVDNGIRNTIAKKLDAEIDGKLFENYVLSELIKLGLFPKYWRTKSKAEVDFIIEKDSDIIPVEVKLTLPDKKIEKSLLTFIDMYRPKKAMVVFYKGVEGKTTIKNCDVTFTNILGLNGLIK